MQRLTIGLILLALIVASALYWNLACDTQALAACTELSSARVNAAVGDAAAAILR